MNELIHYPSVIYIIK